MPTKKPRLIVTLEPSLYDKVKAISKANGTALSLTARDLIREACEDIEDLGLVALARRRLKSGQKGRWLTHGEIWK
ncbi:MAG: antitoxin, RHH family protein [Elusimicrobia bacterium]|nr:antitoxin, RHH family protein [Elusimicrobiota bacterium]